MIRFVDSQKSFNESCEVPKLSLYTFTLIYLQYCDRDEHCSRKDNKTWFIRVYHIEAHVIYSAVCSILPFPDCFLHGNCKTICAFFTSLDLVVSKVNPGQ